MKLSNRVYWGGITIICSLIVAQTVKAAYEKFNVLEVKELRVVDSLGSPRIIMKSDTKKGTSILFYRGDGENSKIPMGIVDLESGPAISMQSEQYEQFLTPFGNSLQDEKGKKTSSETSGVSVKKPLGNKAIKISGLGNKSSEAFTVVNTPCAIKYRHTGYSLSVTVRDANDDSYVSSFDCKGPEEKTYIYKKGKFYLDISFIQKDFTDGEYEITIEP